MKDGFIRVAAGSFKVSIANVKKNAQEIIRLSKEANANHTQVLVLNELCLTGYTIEDLFFQKRVLNESETQLQYILDETKDLDTVIVIGMPLVIRNDLYNCALVLHKGEILGAVPKTYIPNYHEFYEGRHFKSGRDLDEYITLCDQEIHVTTEQLFEDVNHPWLKIGVEICEDVWAPHTPSTDACLNGTTLIVNPSASNNLTGKSDYRRSLISATSARLVCGYVYSNTGVGESTTDVVFSNHHLIYENGTLLKESTQYSTGLIYADMDLEKIHTERIEMTTYESEDYFDAVPFALDDVELDLDRYYDPHPFVPSDKEKRAARCEEVFNIQTHGLMQRLEAAHIKKVVVGMSGGLDSTLALLVMHKAYKMLGRPVSDIIAVTMPCFGTTDRTLNNALTLMKELEVTSMTVNIKDAVNQHFKDINHNPEVHDVTYENCQARERTQVLMDIANQAGGIVVGTGDLSEVALGWSTYNGDHMSMYGVNVSVPKTLVRYLVDYVSTLYKGEVLEATLQDILHTPVSPELLPAKDGEITQKTEDIVGPYELHDFFLYHHARFHYEPQKLLRIAIHTYGDKYDEATIKKWLTLFYRRFFTQQFKRSCIPDGPKVGSVALSPRGDLRMPSDADVSMWLDELR